MFVGLLGRREISKSVLLRVLSEMGCSQAVGMTRRAPSRALLRAFLRAPRFLRALSRALWEAILEISLFRADYAKSALQGAAGHNWLVASDIWGRTQWNLQCLQMSPLLWGTKISTTQILWLEADDSGSAELHFETITSLASLITL